MQHVANLMDFSESLPTIKKTFFNKLKYETAVQLLENSGQDKSL